MADAPRHPIKPDSDVRDRGFSLGKIRANRASLREAHRGYMARLQLLGVSEDLFQSAFMRTLDGSSSVHEILIADGIITAADYFGLVARDLGLPFTESVRVETVNLETGSPCAENGKTAQVFCRNHSGVLVLHIAPDRTAEAALRDLLDRDPFQAGRIVISTPRSIARALRERQSASLAAEAKDHLWREHPALSARDPLVPWQAYAAGLASVLLCQWAILAPQSFFTFIQVLLAVVFTFALYVRLGALLRLKRKRSEVPERTPSVPAGRYSVLVALYKEAPVAAQLVRAMSSLEWPQDRFEVLYLCEQHDHETIEALKRQNLPPNHQLILVPNGLPRTKPRALNFGLHVSSGDYIVIYDAEDRPHPGQLMEAGTRFAKSGQELACLQAPLEITNGSASWLARMFAFEYHVHFLALLPHLAALGVPLPLGGTSNHFRRNALNAVGGWDPYNVTEDADLGIRFARFGYQVGVIGTPTREDAPETFREWYPQRTRWQKGWMQTALVHLRAPRETVGVLGGRNALYFGGLMAGFILAPLLYILSLFLIAVIALDALPFSTLPNSYGLALFCMGFIAYALLGFATAPTMKLRTTSGILAALPVYWLLISAAAWRGVVKLITDPHHWEKTPHRPAALP